MLGLRDLGVGVRLAADERRHDGRRDHAENGDDEQDFDQREAAATGGEAGGSRRDGPPSDDSADGRFAWRTSFL